MIGRWVCIFLTGIVIHFWGKDIGNFLKEITELIYLLYRTLIVIPFGRFTFWITNNTSFRIGVDVSENFVFFIVCLLFSIIVATIILGILLFIGFFVVIGFVFFWVIEGLTRGIVEAGLDGLEEIMDFNIIAYILVLTILAYILGRFFYFEIFPWFYKKIEPILALTIGEFLYYLHKRMITKLLPPICLSIAILMFSIGSWLAIISPVSKYLVPPFKNFANEQWDSVELGWIGLKKK